MIFNVARGVFRSFSTRHQFYTFTKLKSFLPRFPSSLQLFLFFRFLLFSPLTCPVPLYLLEIQSCFLRLATRYLHGRRSNLQWRIDLPIFRAKSIAKDWKKCHCFGKYIYGTIQSQWIDISCCDLAYIAFQWVVNYIGVKRTFYFGKM